MTSLSNQNPGDWLFLPKHKLELMFSSIEPYALRGHTFLATFFQLFIPQTRTCIPLFFYQPVKRQLAHVLRLPANQLCAVFPCLCSRQQSILTCNSVKLHNSSIYFSTPTPLHIPFISLHLPFPLSQRALFRRLLVDICSICDACYTQYICS